MYMLTPDRLTGRLETEVSTSEAIGKTDSQGCTKHHDGQCKHNLALDLDSDESLIHRHEDRLTVSLVFTEYTLTSFTEKHNDVHTYSCQTSSFMAKAILE